MRRQKGRSITHLKKQCQCRVWYISILWLRHARRSMTPSVYLATCCRSAGVGYVHMCTCRASAHSGESLPLLPGQLPRNGCNGCNSCNSCCQPSSCTGQAAPPCVPLQPGGKDCRGSQTPSVAPLTLMDCAAAPPFGCLALWRNEQP